ncbi:MAG: glycosyltransferase [Candidatus Goldiibacteriota bacterium]
MGSADNPFVSVIIPVYNSEKVIARCLDAVLDQDYPKNKMEIILSDAGSKDKTLDIVRSYTEKISIIITDNPLKTGEAGKAAGIDKANGSILAFIDSDNIMPGPDFISGMVKPFEDDPEIMGTEPLYFVYEKKDRPLTKYFASSGVNDPLCLFIGNYDRYSFITGKWTGFDLAEEETDEYIKVTLEEKKIPTIGANGTFLRKDLLKKVNYKPYMFDIDVVYEMLKNGNRKFVKVKTGIIHIYAPKLSSFMKKQHRRISDYLFFNKERQRSYPWGGFPLKGIFLFVVYCAAVIPLVFQAVKGFIRKPALYWIYHVPVCEATLFIYGWTFLKAKLTGKAGMKNRDNYSQ